jgi:hypothetical protein
MTADGFNSVLTSAIGTSVDSKGATLFFITPSKESVSLNPVLMESGFTEPAIHSTSLG